MSNNYNSILVTLNILVNGNDEIEKDIKFNIPIYQRLYVWKNEQVQKLLEDTCNAFLKEKENDYYLGGVIAVKNRDRYDLIDGQQRFTTLWLIAKHLQESLIPFLENRMHFSIREHANNFFSNQDIIEDKTDELKNIKDAITTIEKFFLENKVDKLQFSNYLYTKLKLVFTVVPKDVDLNKLFETINSGGVQLQHHELLKAKMLEALKDNPKEQKIYSKLWDSCAFMDNYIENNLAVALNCTKTDIYQKLYSLDNKKIDNLKDVDRVLYFISSKIKNDNQDKKCLQDILEETVINERETAKNEKENEIKVRSIISFSMLLLHTLRIFFKQSNIKDIKEVNEKELLKIFTHKNKEEEKDTAKYGEFQFNSDNVENFINLLWKVRFSFDKHIIKWVNVDDNIDEVHMICDIYPNTDSKSLQRNKELVDSKSFSLLQSMLYHTQPVINHYWLTPLLYKLTIDTYTYASNAKYLQEMDNYLFFPRIEGDLRKNTWEIMGKKLDICKCNCDELMKKIKIEENLGTSFPHYLFYKIEYILWFTGDKSNDFYFRAKNSVEHIEPQTKDGDKNQENNLRSDLLDTFGNLALVSRERNSEFGNLTFKEKKARFESFKDSSQHLKMSLIYKNEIWVDNNCESHLGDIKNKVSKYMNCGINNESK